MKTLKLYVVKHDKDIQCRKKTKALFPLIVSPLGK